MSETIQAFASEFKPTIWHRMGFGHAYIAPWRDDEDEAGRCPDGLLATSMVSETHVHFDFIDRLKLLLTGRLHVFVRTRSERDPGKVESRSAVGIKGWGWR